MDFDLPCSSIIGGNGNWISAGIEGGRGKAGSVCNPVCAYDIRIFSTPQVTDTVHWEARFTFALSRAKAAGHAVFAAVSNDIPAEGVELMKGALSYSHGNLWWAGERLPGALPAHPTPLHTCCIQLSPCFSAEVSAPTALARFSHTRGEAGRGLGDKLTLPSGRTVPLGDHRWARPGHHACPGAGGAGSRERLSRCGLQRGAELSRRGPAGAGAARCRKMPPWDREGRGPQPAGTARGRAADVAPAAERHVEVRESHQVLELMS